MTQLWYLASPYSSFDAGEKITGRAYRLAKAKSVAAMALGSLLQRGRLAFSPITHFHDAAIEAEIDPVDNDYWNKVNLPFMEMCCGCIVLRAPGWENSKGMAHEVKWFRDRGRPVEVMHYEADS